MKRNYSLGLNEGEIFLELGDDHCSNRVENMKILDESGDVLISFEDGEFFRHFYDESKMLKKKQTFGKDHTFEYTYEKSLVGNLLVPCYKKIVEKKRYEYCPEETITTTFFYKADGLKRILTKTRIKETHFDRYERITENEYDSHGLKIVRSKEVYKDFYSGGIITTLTCYNNTGYIVSQTTDYEEME